MLLKYLSFGVLAALLGCANKEASSCGSDTNCPSQELCLDGRCVDPCTNDYDCPGEMVCEQGRCANEGNGGGVYQPQSFTPAEAYDGFREALQGNNLEKAVSYFSPAVQDKYHRVLSQRNLEQLAPQMPVMLTSPDIPSQNFVSKEVEIGGEEYSIIFDCTNGICEIISF